MATTDSTGFLTESPRRPVAITVLAVLIVISGILNLLASIVLVVGSQSAEFVTNTFPHSGNGTVLWLGIFGVALALAYLAVARGLLRGNRPARTLATVVTVLSLLAAVLGLVFNTGNLRWGSLGSAVLAALVLYLLYSPKANAFFRSR